MLGKLHRETLAEQAAAGLMQFILEKNLKPGEMLPSEIMLATEFGVSRQVIREALKSLQGQGVIEIINPVIGNEVFNSVAIQRAGVRPFRDHAAPVAIHRSEDLHSSAVVKLRKSDFEISNGDGTIAEIEPHDNRTERRTHFDGALDWHGREHPQ